MYIKYRKKVYMQYDIDRFTKSNGIYTLYQLSRQLYQKPIDCIVYGKHLINRILLKNENEKLKTPCKINNTIKVINDSYLSIFKCIPN